MMIRTRRKNESWIRRLTGRIKRPQALPVVLSEDQFRIELAKEVYRSDRRLTNREFGLIRILMSNSEEIEMKVLEAFRDRLRVTDSVGWYDSNLAILLPETDKEGTLACANLLAALGIDEGLEFDTEVSIYPIDDELIALADELKIGGDVDEEGSSGTGGPHANWSGNGKNGSDKESANTNSLKIKCTKHAFVRPLPTPWWKRTIDIVGAGFGLVCLSPVFLVAAVAIKLTSSGPVFFRQIREGKNGRHFGILKFRTMVTDAEELQAELLEMSEQDGPAFKLTNDPRVTTIGRYLRKSCVDELPQLWNVLLGQMSLVGPRPLPIHESHGCTAWQRARLTVLPGLTCTWQVYGGRDVKFSEWMRMDIEYIVKRSFWYDLKLIYSTALVAILHRGSV